MEKRSPLKAPPLRLPGQSLQDEINDQVDKGREYIVLISIFMLLAAEEWIRFFFKAPPQPIFFTVLAAGTLAYGIWKIIPIRRQLRSLKQARDGEKAVGQFLERLRETGYQVFHDVVGNGFNIDHVLVGPSGVFTVETKTISKPVKGQAKIRYDGETILVDGFKPDRDPIVQAKAQAGWLRNFIKESAGKDVKVRPVVLYPGWYIEGKSTGREVWVLEPKGLPGFLEHEKAVLESQDVASIAYQVSTYIRTLQEQ